MRLSEKERHGIAEAVAAVSGKSGWQLFLHGSRVADSAFGGDIDLLLLCGADKLAEMKSKKRKILVEIEDRLGERRIDLTIAGSDPAAQSEFVRLALTSATKLDERS